MGLILEKEKLEFNKKTLGMIKVSHFLFAHATKKLNLLDASNRL